MNCDEVTISDGSYWCICNVLVRWKVMNAYFPHDGRSCSLSLNIAVSGAIVSSHPPFNVSCRLNEWIDTGNYSGPDCMETLSLLWWGLWWCYLPHVKITPEFILELDYGKKKKLQSFSNPHQLTINHFVNYCLIFLRQPFYFKYFTWKSKKKVSKKVFLSIKPISHMQLSLPGSLLPLWDVYGCWWGSEEAPGGRGLVYHWRFL